MTIPRICHLVVSMAAILLSSCSHNETSETATEDSRPTIEEPASKGDSESLQHQKPIIEKSRIPFEVKSHASMKEPPGVMYFGEDEPLFVVLNIQKQEIIDSVRYGQVQIHSIQDDLGNDIKLLHPPEGEMKEDLTRELVDINHFFLETPSILRLVLIVAKPDENATGISIRGSLKLESRHVVTIANILSRLDAPLIDEELDPIGQFTVSIPPQDESDTDGSLAVDFVGNRENLHDIEILRADGYRISTGGTGIRTPDGSRIIRWTAGDLPTDAQLRIVLSEELELVEVPLNVKDISIKRD